MQYWCNQGERYYGTLFDDWLAYIFQRGATLLWIVGVIFFLLIYLFLLLSERNYTSLDEVYSALVSREVRGVLIEANVAATRTDLFNHPSLTVLTLVPHPLSFGYVTAGHARNLRDFIEEEVMSREEQIQNSLKELTGYLEVKHCFRRAKSSVICNCGFDGSVRDWILKIFCYDFMRGHYSKIGALRGVL